MIFDDETRDWIRDARRHRRTEAKVNAFAESWNHGLFNRRIAAAMAEVSFPSVEAVTQAVRALFAEGGGIEALIGELGEAMRHDPFFVPPFRHINSDVHRGLIAYEDELVSIAAGVAGAAQLAAKKNGTRGATSIVFSGQVAILKFIKAGGARLSFWEAPLITAEFSAAQAGKCRRVGERDMADGEILVIDGRRQGFVIEHAAANLVLLQATVKPDQAPLSVEYDSTTHEYVGCSAADDSASRIQMIATLLRKLDHQAAFPAIAAFLDNKNFFVRWHVMRELLGLDARAALPHLERMATLDSHPENRRAARQAVDQVEAMMTDRRKAA